MVGLSAVIISYNEEKNIVRCLKSLECLADEILVVDSYSTDRTEEICREFGVRFVQHKFESHIQQKNRALYLAKNDYVLSLDADEELSEDLQKSILEIKKNWKYDGYLLKRKTSYTNSRDPRDVRFVERKIRLWDRRKGVWGGINPHDTVIMDIDSRLGLLKGDMLHYSYFSIDAHRKKADYFSSISANSLFTSGKRSNWLKIIFSPFWKFVRSYIFRLGILDGKHGFRICISSALGAYLKYRKLKQLNSGKHLDIPESVCFFNTNKQWGGGEKWSLTMAGELKQKGYNIVVVAYRGSELLRRSRQIGLNTIGLKMRNNSFINPFLLLRIKRIYQANNVATVFLNLSIDLKTGAKMAGRIGVRRIIYRRGLSKSIRKNRRNTWLLTSVVSNIIATSLETRKGILRNFNSRIIDEKISLIYNGVRIPEIKLAESNGSKLILGSAGRISPEKGFCKLVKLGTLLRDAQIPFEIKLAGEGEQLNQIKEDVANAGLEKYFRFMGFVKDMRSFYDSINIYLLTSKQEGFANVLLEAMSYAKPVIAFDIGSPSELVTNGRNGFIVPADNIEAMAEKIIEFYKSPALINEMGDQARKRIKKDFSLDRHIAQVEELIK